MQTRTLIKDTAAVARVTELTEGSAYRRLIEKDSYASAQIALGVVTGVLNNGETTAITALEVSKGRFTTDSEITQKVFEADNDLVLFPVDADEVQGILTEAREAAERKIADAERTLRQAREKHEELERVSERIAAGTERQSVTDTDTLRALDER